MAVVAVALGVGCFILAVGVMMKLNTPEYRDTFTQWIAFVAVFIGGPMLSGAIYKVILFCFYGRSEETKEVAREWTGDCLASAGIALGLVIGISIVSFALFPEGLKGTWYELIVIGFFVVFLSTALYLKSMLRTTKA